MNFLLEEWHCTLRGPAGTEFEGGLYHFRILLPAEYPFRPPSLMMLTPNGRFELNTKVGHIPFTWVVVDMKVFSLDMYQLYKL
jgi:ubiquitin-conjugating enzyme E2 J1